MVVVIKIRQPARLPQCETGSQCHMLPLLALRCTPAASKDAPSIRSRARSAGRPLLLRPRLRRRLDPFYRVAPGQSTSPASPAFPSAGSRAASAWTASSARSPRCRGPRPTSDARPTSATPSFRPSSSHCTKSSRSTSPTASARAPGTSPRPPADARERLPCYRQAAPLQVPAQEWAVPPRRRRPEKEARDVDQGALGLDRSRGDGRPHGPADPRLL